MDEVERVAAKIIRKANRENEPLEALTQTPEYGKFERALYLAIRKQYKYFTASPPNDLQVHDLAKWLDDNLPTFSEYLDAQDVFEHYKFCFMWGIKSQYQRFGLNMRPHTAKLSDGLSDGVLAGFAWSYDGTVATFNLTNPDYIAAMKDASSYLLNLSSIDQTTKNQLIKIVQDGRTAGKTIQEIAADLPFEEASQWRAMRIARTESANSLGQGNFAAMVKNGVTEKSWVAAGGGCDICRPNVDDGQIPVNNVFSSGNIREPAHPNCECYTEAGEIDLDSIDVWNGQ